MKTGIHPQIFDTKVHCNGCNIEFTTRSTVPEITVEICSNCHPFYTGKQKLLDTAGRVEKFEARRKAAAAAKAGAQKQADKKADVEAKAAQKNDPELKEIAEELKTETVDLPEAKPENTESSDS
jgi:large subunit ribosomal protein L31